MVNCSVLGCKSRSERKEPNISFHRFPKDPTIRDEWSFFTGRGEWQPNSHSRMCSRHFKQSCFTKDKRHIFLNLHAKPTFFKRSEGEGISEDKPPIETSPCGTSDDDLADVDVDEEIRYIRTRVDALKQQSKDYDKIFNEFGETVKSRLKSLPIESALRLHKRLEIVIEKFCSSLPEPAHIHTPVHSCKEKGKTSEKVSSINKKSSKQESKTFFSDHKIKVKAELATTSSDPESKPLNKTFTPNRLAKANEDYNVPVPMPVAKKPAVNRSSMSCSVNTGSQSITASKKPNKRPLLENPNSEISETVKQARHNDDEIEIEVDIKLEKDECIVKTEYNSDNDDYNDPLQFAG